MSDYYDPFPRMSLTRPIVIAGQLGCGTRLIGRSLCARTGLPFVDIDRKIEHEAGRSLSHIALSEGADRVSTWAESLLERLGRKRPCPVIVLDHAWPRSQTLPRFERRVDFIHVQRDRAFLLERMRRELSGPASWLLQDEQEDAAGVWEGGDLAPWFARRSPRLEKAGILLDAGSLHPHRVAHLLLDSLESVADARVLQTREEARSDEAGDLRSAASPNPAPGERVRADRRAGH